MGICNWFRAEMTLFHPTSSPQVPVTRDSPRQLVPQSNNDWAPRVGFAYQVTSKTVVRSGFGVFYTSYEPGPLSIPNPGNNPPFYLSSLWAAPAFGVPNPLVNQLSQGLPANAFVQPAAPALFAVDPGLRNPYVLHWNFTVQRSLPWGMVWETGYAGSSGNHLYEFDDANQPAPTADSSSPINARRPRPFLGGSLTYWCSCDHSSYHSLVTKVEKRLSNNLSFLAAYTWGKSIDEVSQASLSFANDGAIRNQNDRSAEKAVSGYDIAQRFVMSFTYELPFARNLTSRPAKLLLDGWQVLGIDSFATGIPFTVDATTNFSNAGGDTRPDVIPGVSIVPPGGGEVQQWFNAAAFRNPALGYWGNVGRNTGTMPSTVNVDFSVFKNFRLAERKQLQFRAEVFNLPNYVNFTTITKVFDAPDHGALTASSAARQVQFALKLLF